MYWYKNRVEISELVGKTFTKIKQDDDELFFYTGDNAGFVMRHDQDCCETVYLDDVIGDLDDLIGSPIIESREDTNADDPGAKDNYDESYTWTFYNIATNKGTVTLRWYGSSNGYYSESVDLYRLDEEEAPEPT